MIEIGGVFPGYRQYGEKLYGEIIIVHICHIVNYIFEVVREYISDTIADLKCMDMDTHF